MGTGVIRLVESLDRIHITIASPTSRGSASQRHGLDKLLQQRITRELLPGPGGSFATTFGFSQLSPIFMALDDDPWALGTIDSYVFRQQVITIPTGRRVRVQILGLLTSRRARHRMLCFLLRFFPPTLR